MKKITTLPNENCSHTFHHYKMNSMLSEKDEWRALEYGFILGSPVYKACNAATTLPCLTDVSQSLPLYSAITPLPLLRNLHASPSHPCSLIPASLLLLASINSPFPLFPPFFSLPFPSSICPLISGPPCIPVPQLLSRLWGKALLLIQVGEVRTILQPLVGRTWARPLPVEWKPLLGTQPCASWWQLTRKLNHEFQT